MSGERAPSTFRPLGLGEPSASWQARCLERLRIAGVSPASHGRADFDLELGAGKGGASRADGAPPPRLGRWSFRVDGLGVGGAGRACRDALLEGRASVRARLVAYTEARGEVVLREGRLPLRPYSLRRSVDDVMEELAAWPALACRGLEASGRLEGPRILGAASPAPDRGGREGRGAGESAARAAIRGVRCRLRAVGNRVRIAWRTLFRHDHWNVGLVHRPIGDFLEPGPESEVEWWDALPTGGFRADPFGLRLADELLVLYEEMSYDTGHGRIVGETLGGDGERTARLAAMEGEGHYSYPFLLEHDSEIYCVPETADRRRVVLYRAVEPPGRWEPAATLLEGIAAVDPTLFRHEGRWWLLCTDADAGPRHVLMAWHAPEPAGPWSPHAANPVKVDIHAARPAGTPFRHRGELYRPAQDGAGSYGEAVVINRVVRLTPDEFAEEEVRRITLPPESDFPSGVHTLSALGPDMTLLDGKRAGFSMPELVRRLRSVLRGGGR